MFGEDKNLKDNQEDSVKDMSFTPVPYKSKNFISNSLPKLNKLVTAVYIVTDIMDKEEPIRLKLRTLVVEILSDINSISKLNLSEKIQTILSFLDIASTINLISEMNFNILKKEFLDLSDSIKESNQVNPIWLEEFLQTSSLDKGSNEKGFLKNSPHPNPLLTKERMDLNSKGHTRIGVQKGSTLMKVLSDKTQLLSDKDFSNKDENNFNILKKERRNDIIRVIKDNGGSATITDIKAKASGSLISCGEKTLQRELVSMVKMGVLNRTGEKRWSKYFIK